ncbi:MAG: flagellar protein FlaG [Geminicoccaceae bacterium]
MLKELSGTMPLQQTPSPQSARPEPRSNDIRPDPVSGVLADRSGAEENAATIVEQSRTLDQAAEKAARKMFPGREIQVESYRDEQSGRFVYRVADKQSGRVIHQSPPDELLRFFASAREGEAGPLVHLEA